MAENKLKISICLGSSCFSNGDRKIINAVQEYLTDNNLEDRVILENVHCLGHCTNGPIMRINEQLFIENTEKKAIAIIEKHLDHFQKNKIHISDE